jgi:hypothetical protein
MVLRATRTTVQHVAKMRGRAERSAGSSERARERSQTERQ